MKFCWTTIYVNDLEESLIFYMEIVGLKLNRRFPAGEAMEIAFLGEGETQVELICNKNVDGVKIGEDISIGFEVESIDEKMELMKERGIKLHGGPFSPQPSVKFIYVQDPNGLKIQFVENLK